MIRIVPLEKSHDVRDFDCTQGWMTTDDDLAGAADMNEFLRRRALDQAKRGVSRTFVAVEDDEGSRNRVLAYYSTGVGHLEPETIPKVVSPNMTIPVIHLLRLAVDKRFQGKRLGKRLLAYFFSRAISVASEIGIYAVVLEPLNDRVRAFYEQFGFQPLPGDATRMYLSIRDIRAWVQASGSHSP